MSKIRTFVLALGMVAASWVAFVYTPKPLYAANYKPEVTLAQLMPKQFGDWQSDDLMAEAIISPDMKASLARYYTDTLSRTYTNSRGDRVMLSLAFGADQGRAMQVHKPEVCYVGQGFKIGAAEGVHLSAMGKDIPAMRLVATLGPRIEPLTYWIRSGDDVVRGWLEQNMARVKYGLQGYLPDGLLFRVSTVGSDVDAGYASQARFVQEFIPALSPQARAMVLGHVF